MKSKELLSLLTFSLPVIFNSAIGQTLVLSDVEADRIVAEEMAALNAAKSIPPEFTVLETVSRLEGNSGVIFHKVIPPTPQKIDTNIKSQQPFPPESISGLMSTDYREHRTLSLGIQVFDDEVSELIWRKNGQTIHAYSNIDFGYLTPLGDFEGDGVVYSFYAITTRTTREQEMERRKVIRESSDIGFEFNVPELKEFSGSDPEYIVYVDPDEKVPEELLEALDALHRYYIDHETELKNAAVKRKALAEARERYKKAHPEVEEPRVINYWKVENPAQEGR